MPWECHAFPGVRLDLSTNATALSACMSTVHAPLQAAKRYRQFMRRAALYTAGGTLMGLVIFGLYRCCLHCTHFEADLKLWRDSQGYLMCVGCQWIAHRVAWKHLWTMMGMESAFMHSGAKKKRRGSH